MKTAPGDPERKEQREQDQQEMCRDPDRMIDELAEKKHASGDRQGKGQIALIRVAVLIEAPVAKQLGDDKGCAQDEDVYRNGDDGKEHQHAVSGGELYQKGVAEDPQQLPCHQSCGNGQCGDDGGKDPPDTPDIFQIVFQQLTKHP